LDLAVVLKFLHIASGTLMLGGLVARAFALAQAARSSEIRTVASLVQLAGRIERQMVIPGSMLLLVIGAPLALIGGWPVLGFLQGASANWLLVSLVLYLAVFPLIIFVFLPRGKVFEQALASALAKGEVTPELAAAFDDRAVRNAHIAEAVAVTIVLYLMVAKPF
jgi:uncharacterized membrane protein